MGVCVCVCVCARARARVRACVWGILITGKYTTAVLGRNFDPDAFVVKLQIIPMKMAIRTPPPQ